MRLVLLGYLVAVANVHSQPVHLAFKPVDVQYSKPLDRLIMVSANPNQVHLVNPVTGAETTINLSLAPLSLSVSSAGTHAAVGHDGWISYVNLSAGYVEKNIAISFKASVLILTGNGTIWAPPSATVNVATGTQTSSAYSPWGAVKPALHPNGNWIYYTRGGSPDDVIKGDISSGTFQYLYDSTYHGSFPICAGIFYSADGNRLLTGCGTFFRTTASSTDDITYNGSLSAASLVNSAADSAITRKYAVIPGINYNGTATDTELQFYDNEHLTLLGRVALPKYTSGAITAPWRGRHVFYSPDASRIHVVLQADAAAKLVNDYSVYSLTLSSGSACSPSFGPASANLPAAGGTVDVNVTAADGCLWQASSNVSWVSLTAGAVSSGSGKLTIQAAPNLQTASRSGTVTIAGLTYTVTQDAAAAPGSNPVTISPVRPIRAEYSTALDRMILISTNPDLLTIFDPVTSSGQTVSLSMPPTALSISTDGLRAAVGHDGRISYVNLLTGIVEKTFPVTTTVYDLALGAKDIFAFPLRDQWEDVRIVNIATGTETLWNHIYAGSTAGKISPNGKYLYINSSKRYDITQATLPSAFDAISGHQPRQWFSQDGARLFNGSGQVFRLSDVASQDLQYNGTIESEGVRAVADSSVQQVTATIATGSTKDTAIKFFGQQYLAVLGSIAIPKLTSGSNSYDAHGRYLFWNAAGNRLFAIVQADETSGLLNDYAIYSVSLNGGCDTSLGSPSVNAAAAGGSLTLSVTAKAGCAWKAISSASWLTISANSLSAGPATVSYIVDANPTTSARTATITVDGKTFTVNQAAGTQVQISAVTGLSFRVADAEYSNALNRIVAISGSPSRLNIYDPAKGVNTAVALPLPGNAISVHPSGLRAAVCHDGLVTIVNLQTATIEKTVPVSVSCYDIVFAGNEYVYMSVTGGWGTSSSVNVSTGVETKADLLYSGIDFRLNAAGDAVYTSNTGTSAASVTRFSIASGAMKEDYESEWYPAHPFGYRIWFTSDGRMVGDSGSVFRTGSTKQTDFVYTGTLSGFTGHGSISAIAHSTARRLFASIGSGGVYSTPANDGHLFLHGGKYLALASKVTLPKITVGAVSAASRGKFVFWNSTGEKAYVIMQAESSAGFLNDFAVYTLSPEFTPGCSVTLGAMAGTAIAFADTGSVAVSAATDCVWEVKPNAPWIEIDSGTLGIGIGNVSYSVLANSGATARTGTIAIGPQTFTITQAGSSTSYTISGQVTKAGSGLAGVTITLTGGSGGTQTTNTTGSYAFGNLAAGNYTVTPSLANHTFTPASAVLNNLQSNQTANFSASGNSAPAIPSVGTVSPASGSGVQQTFTITYTDGNGAHDIAAAFFMVNSVIDAANSCFIEYNPAANTFRLMNDAGTSWSDPIVAGSSSRSNSRCTLAGTGAGSTRSGNILTVTLPITFAQTDLRLYKTYGLAMDVGNLNSGWKLVGDWNVPADANAKPDVISLSPTIGSGVSGTFTAVFRHPNGAAGHYLGYILFLPTPNVVTFNAQGTCLIEYNRISNGMRLIDNAGTNWIGPLEGVPVAPTTAPLSNNACSVNVAGATAVLSGKDMTVTVPVTFKLAGVTTTMGTFIQESDVNNNWTDFRQFGNWQVPGAGTKPGPYVRSASTSISAGSSVLVYATFGHTASVTNLAQVHLRFNDSIVGGAPCHVVYFPFDDSIALINDAQNALVSLVPFGSPINNPGGRCAMPAGGTKVPGTTEMLLRVPLTFNTGTFAGAKKIYMTTFDNTGAVSHWLQTGTFVVQ